MNRVIDSRFFDQPGFPVLYCAWAEVFDKNEKGADVLEPNHALARLSEAADQVKSEESLSPEALATLERVACLYARDMPLQLVMEAEEALYA